MLKEVGASAQIVLGKRFAGQLFDVTVGPDNTIVMKPARVVPSEPDEANAAWLREHAGDIAAYNAWSEARETYSQRIQRWRETGE